MADEHVSDLKRWVERLDAYDERLDALERRAAVQDAAVTIVRWIVALSIPFLVVMFEVVTR